MLREHHDVDFCVIGGGLAGMCAAIAAARHGVKVVLVHDRPVLGGNASSEARVWICGANGKDNRETGLIEEFELENRYRNPLFNYYIWDSILYEKVRFEPNITLLLNCTCNDAKMDGEQIKSVKAWQMTTQKWHYIKARLFADCSGDSVLAPLSGAEYRVGREASSEYNEDIALEKSDKKTMGLSCLLQTRETLEPVDFIPPKWANKYESCNDFKYRAHDLNSTQNFWWLEIGGEQDTIHETEEIRDELLKIVFGVWDHIKNRCTQKDKYRNWALDWIGFLPGKRESRRYIGDHVLTQQDILNEGRFDDIVAYGGWPMDDHHSEGFLYDGEPTTFHPAPSPFGIPYRCLYSKNIENLFFAGRNISYTHVAMSSARVMATCALLGQAVGTAASIAANSDLTPKQVYQKKIKVLQQMLMDDDCYLPWQKRSIPELTQKAKISASQGIPVSLVNGVDRVLDGKDNGWTAELGQWVEYRFERPEKINAVRLVFDSNLNRLIRKEKLCKDIVLNENDPVNGSSREMRCTYPLKFRNNKVPEIIVREFKIEIEDSKGDWTEVFCENNNYQRHVRIPLNVTTAAIRFVPQKTWGAKKAHIFAFDVR